MDNILPGVFLILISLACTYSTPSSIGPSFKQLKLVHDNIKSSPISKELEKLSVSEDVLCGITDENLRHDPDTKYNASGLISSKGYPVQYIEVPTQDGFLLGIHRIPHGRNEEKRKAGPRPAVLLQHGLLGDSSNWLVNLANQSLAFILADSGYDVWLANSRGNTYSRKHQTLKTSQREFWYWSWDEMARYDLPAMVDYIINATGNKQISYIGHSQGTTVGFAGLSINETLQRKINLFVALGPVANATDISGGMSLLAHPDIYETLVKTLDELHLYNFLPALPRLDRLFANTVCSNKLTVSMCELTFYILAGYSCEHMNQSRISVITAQGSGGTSIWTMEHWGQITYAKNFLMFDYGPDENLKRYGQSTPPAYKVSKIATPIALFYGDRDILADPTDVQLLKNNLKSITYDHEIQSYGHLDFVFAFDAVDYLYTDILKLLNGLYL